MQHVTGRELYTFRQNMDSEKQKNQEKTRFYQEVYGDDGIYDMECYNDFHNIEEAIIDTLEGACLAKNN